MQLVNYYWIFSPVVVHKTLAIDDLCNWATHNEKSTSTIVYEVACISLGDNNLPCVQSVIDYFLARLDQEDAQRKLDEKQDEQNLINEKAQKEKEYRADISREIDEKIKTALINR